MSNIPVNSPPDAESLLREEDGGAEEPEPERSPGLSQAKQDCLVVEKVWQGTIDEIPAAFDERIDAIVHAATSHRGFSTGRIGVCVTTDDEIREINVRHLDHDYATDVISFPYLCQSPRVEGELVVSLETAVRESASVGWDWESELTLYIVHGVLHLCGMDDQSSSCRRAMRTAEQEVMRSLGIKLGEFSVDAEERRS